MTRALRQRCRGCQRGDFRRIGQGRVRSAGSADTIRQDGYWTVGRSPVAGIAGGPSLMATTHMHIALVHHHVGGKAGGGGGVRLMLELGPGLVKRGHRVTVACHDFLPDSEFAYASDQLEIRSVRRGISELPAGNAALARRFWLDMPKVARLVPADADVVNAHEWLALRRDASPPGAYPSRWCGRATTNRCGSARSCRSRRSPVPLAGAARTAGRADAGRTCSMPAVRRIAVLSAQQVDMVHRSYRKDASVVPVGPADALLRPAGPGGGARQAWHLRRCLPGCGLGHPRGAPAL